MGARLKRSLRTRELTIWLGVSTRRERAILGSQTSATSAAMNFKRYSCGVDVLFLWESPGKCNGWVSPSALSKQGQPCRVRALKEQRCALSLKKNSNFLESYDDLETLSQAIAGRWNCRWPVVCGALGGQFRLSFGFVHRDPEPFARRHFFDEVSTSFMRATTSPLNI